ncbi:hypothetical protein JCGZ_17968 [Jatropha curcas]|uniref:Bifunctional inhibitor/plant lipid transfer protein/seed storage helical domain-containing protein n=1 Tax=Jatropha curcas TaxID=180498 RepID=A0A067K3I6_JATCU|nr:non-specific lipid transfer protein GPI-anchored 1 [Jatropha curcas]KDP26810.1 hypothetical protein JCGZ_17968 [Jatropha curcas]
MESLKIAIMVMFLLSSVNGANLAEDCSADLQKVTPCLNYATGKANTPTKDCCGSVKELKESDPKCLCFMIQQTHNGSAQIKSLGIQETKLLQLPSACQLQNASISFCPKLLGLSPSSPDAAIFTNATASSSSTPTSSTGTSTPEKSDDSSGTNHGSGPLAIAAAIFIYSFSTVSTSIF